MLEHRKHNDKRKGIRSYYLNASLYQGGHQGLQSEMLSMISNSQLDAKKNTPLEEKELKKCKFVRTTEKGRLYLRLYPEAPSKGNNNLIAIKINHVYKIIDENGDLLANITWNLFSTQFKVEDKAGNELLSVTYVSSRLYF